MAWLDRTPLRRRLMIVMFVSWGSVLGVTCGVLALYEFYDFRRVMARDSTVMADIVATNSRAALSFDDENAARDVLESVQSDAHVTGAAVYDRHGRMFAEFVRPGTPAAFPARPGADGAHFAARSIVVVRAILEGRRRLGTLFLETDLEGTNRRLALFAAVAGLALGGSILIALVLSSRLQRPITAPILALTETARTIAEHKDYAVRVPGGAHGEVGVLTDAFNQMIAGIQERETALRAGNQALAAEIAERQRAEGRIQAQLGRLAQLNQITRAIGERQDVESIFQAVVRSLEDQLPADFVCVCLYDAATEALTVTRIGMRSLALGEQLTLSEHASIPVDRNGLGRCVRGHLVYEPDVSEVAMPFAQRLAGVGLRAVVMAPLLVESKVFGVLVAGRGPPHSFNSGDCEFIKQLSEHVALAAHQAQLYTALQQAYDDLRQTQQAVMQQERLRALGQMASGIAHDINNAISPISLYIESILERERGLSLQTREWLTLVAHAVDDVTHTVSRLREFYRQREPQLALAAVKLNPLVEQATEITRARWCDMPQQRGLVVELRCELDPQLPGIMAVESEVREALINLIFNAVDAMPEGGRLTLRTRRIERPGREGGDALVAIEIVDTGVGMNEETQRRCLEPFFTTKGERGTGLGLAMVYGIVRRHGADLEIESAVGRGTTVRLVFAAIDPGAKPAAPAPPPLRPAGRLRLLIIDDDPLLLRSLRETLEGDGHIAVTANGGQAGINEFVGARERGEPFSAVITDLGMPYVDGRKVASTIKAAESGTMVILLTGWGQRLIEERDIPAHVDCVLSKPPKLRELREALARVPV